MTFSLDRMDMQELKTLRKRVINSISRREYAKRVAREPGKAVLPVGLGAPDEAQIVKPNPLDEPVKAQAEQREILTKIFLGYGLDMAGVEQLLRDSGESG